MAGRKLKSARMGKTMIDLSNGDCDRILNEILDDVANQNGVTGSAELHQVCVRRGYDYSMIKKAIESDDVLNNKYKSVRKWTADLYAEEVIRLADKAASETEPGSSVAISALDKQIKARMWRAEKDYPEWYGNKLSVENVNINLVKILDEARGRVIDTEFTEDDD